MRRKPRTAAKTPLSHSITERANWSRVATAAYTANPSQVWNQCGRPMCHAMSAPLTYMMRRDQITVCCQPVVGIGTGALPASQNAAGRSMNGSAMSAAERIPSVRVMVPSGEGVVSSAQSITGVAVRPDRCRSIPERLLYGLAERKALQLSRAYAFPSSWIPFRQSKLTVNQFNGITILPFACASNVDKIA